MYVCVCDINKLHHLVRCLLCFYLFISLIASQKGIDVNAELLNGRNALHYAADYGHTDVLNYLISKGGKVDVSLPGRMH